MDNLMNWMINGIKDINCPEFEKICSNLPKKINNIISQSFSKFSFQSRFVLQFQRERSEKLNTWNARNAESAQVNIWKSKMKITRVSDVWLWFRAKKRYKRVWMEDEKALMVFYLFSFSCPMKMKSFGMRACFHLMMQNKIETYIGYRNIFIYLFILTFGTVMQNFCMSVRSGPKG